MTLSFFENMIEKLLKGRALKLGLYSDLLCQSINNVMFSRCKSGPSLAHYIPEESNINFSDSWNNSSPVEKITVLRDMNIYNDFLVESEEQSLLNEVEPSLKRLRYEFDHWDNAIHGYRETERMNWNQENSIILQRVRDIAFPPGVPQLAHVHVLDLAQDGWIKPHIDAVRFCGNTIAGLSLLSDSVMRLVHDKYKDLFVDVFLKRRSFYIMRDSVRYDYTHEILESKESVFCNKQVSKSRRISIICRNQPDRSRG